MNLIPTIKLLRVKAILSKMVARILSKKIVRSELEKLIKKHEGLRLFPYRCNANKLTIGFGRNLDDIGISQQEAEFLLSSDIARASHDIMIIFAQFYTFSENRQNALIDMCLNLGGGGFKKFKKMIQAIKERDWERAAIEAQDSKWYAQVGMRGKEDVKMLREG